MTLLEYTISLQDQGLSQEEIFAKVQIWKKDNPQPEVEEVEEVEEVTTEYETPGLSEVNIPGTLGYYQNKTKNLKLSIDEEADLISNQITNQEVTQDDVAATIQVGGREFSFEQIQYQIDNKAKGFEDVTSIQGYLDKMGDKAKINHHIRPGMEDIYSSVYNPLDEVEISHPLYYKKEDINEVLDFHTWFNDDATQRFDGGDGYQQEAHRLLGEYANKLYGNETTGKEIGVSGQMENGGIVGYADIENQSGDIIDWAMGGTTNFNEKYGRNTFTADDRLFTFDLTGDASRKLAKNNAERGIKSDNRITPINVPAQEDFRLNLLNKEAREKFNFTNDDILEFGLNNLSEEQVELQRLTTEYEAMPDELGEFPNTKKVELGKKIDKIAGDQSLGNKLYDPSTGTLIDVKAKDAPLPTIELFNEAEKISGTDIDTLTTGLSDTFYNLQGLSTDILKMDEWFTKEEYNWTDGSDAMLYSGIGNSQALLTRPENITDDQLEKIKEFAETGKMPEGLTYIPGEHPLATTFNEELDRYTVVNTAIQLNRNLATKQKGLTFLGGQQLLEGVLDVAGNILGGDIGGENYLTSFEQAVTFKDFRTKF